MSEIDLTLALQLQAQFEEELRVSLLKQQEEKNKQKKEEIPLFIEFQSKKKNGKPMEEPQQEKLSVSLVDPTWEMIDPNPDIHTLFLTFNNQFFWGRLAGIEVRWSPRMTLCAGVCCYEGRGGLCSVRLSLPLLKLRPRKDLVETLLHEMIHAYLFVTANNRDRDGHGPEFHKHMYRINGVAGTNISVFHTFHDEVDVYRQHIWQCNGPCRSRQPYFGLLKRSMNRAPGPKDHWWERHQQTCGGTYIKIQEPDRAKTTKKETKRDSKNTSDGCSDIRKYITFTGKGNSLGGITSKNVQSKDRKEPTGVNKSGSSKENTFVVSDTEKRAEGGNKHQLDENKEKTKKVRGINSVVSGEVSKIKVTGASRSNVHGFGSHSPARKKARAGNGVVAGKPSGSKNTAKKNPTGHGATGMAVRGSGSQTVTVKRKTGTPTENKLKTDNHEASCTAFEGHGYTLGGVTGKVSKLLSSTPQFQPNSKQPSSVVHIQTDSSSEVHSDPKLDRRDSPKSRAGNTTQELNKSLDCYVVTPLSSSSSSPSSSSLSAAAAAECVRETVRCPVCDIPVPFMDINQHIDDCVGDLNDEDMVMDVTKETCERNIPSDGEISFGNHITDNDNVGERSQAGSMECSVDNESEKYPCPVCNECYSPATIIQHLDSHF